MIVVKSGEEWSFEKIDEIYKEIEDVALNVFNLDVYRNQLEVITSEQMLDAYASVGLPIYYNHWSFGEQFLKERNAYIKGRMGLAYEIVINSDPCIAYLMEENTMLMQTLVIAHASFGHNHFFKNNYMFTQWTDAEGIIDYLGYAKKLIATCEKEYGSEQVEAVLDAAHALQLYGVNKYKRPRSLSAAVEESMREERDEYNQQQLNLIWNTIPTNKKKDEGEDVDTFPSQPEENLLYFIEKNAPNMEEWKREVIRIVRIVSQYFYPQRQTQLMNEGCATYFHYKIMHELHDRGHIDVGAMLEFYISHSGVTYQSEAFLDNGDENPYYTGQINVYALGFAMYKDIERVATEPTDEDKEWFKGQEWVGCGDGLGTILWAIKNFKDESFVKQFLSPKVIRDFKLFVVCDDENDPKIEVTAIHNDHGYKMVRDKLSRQYNLGYNVPDIQVTNVDRWGDRSLTLTHYMSNNRPLHNESTIDTLKYFEYLWGYNVCLESIDSEGNLRNSVNLNSSDDPIIDIFEDD